MPQQRRDPTCYNTTTANVTNYDYADNDVGNNPSACTAGLFAMATPTLIDMPDPPSNPDTPTEAPYVSLNCVPNAPG